MYIYIYIFIYLYGMYLDDNAQSVIKRDIVLNTDQTVHWRPRQGGNDERDSNDVAHDVIMLRTVYDDVYLCRADII